MKHLRFFTEAEFLAQLDGKVYAVCNYDGTYLCDVLEETLVDLLDRKVIANKYDEEDFHFQFPLQSDYGCRIQLNIFEQYMFREFFGVQIDILENKR